MCFVLFYVSLYFYLFLSIPSLSVVYFFISHSHTIIYIHNVMHYLNATLSREKEKIKIVPTLHNMSGKFIMAAKLHPQQTTKAIRLRCVRNYVVTENKIEKHIRNQCVCFMIKRFAILTISCFVVLFHLSSILPT